jgi:steroid delta-isomerase-like uncharacterized protein
MSQESMVDAARGFIDAYNGADWQSLETGLAGDCIYDELATGQHVEGAHEVVEYFQGWARAMPDAKGTISNIFAGDGEVALELTWRGTFTGPLAGPGGDIAPTGKKQVTPAAMIFKFEGDEIKESHQYFDSLALFQQLGVLPEPAQV